MGGKQILLDLAGAGSKQIFLSFKRRGQTNTFRCRGCWEQTNAVRSSEAGAVTYFYISRGWAETISFRL